MFVTGEKDMEVPISARISSSGTSAHQTMSVEVSNRLTIPEACINAESLLGWK
jgi:hypothetical protein